jgi:sorting nexin-1/2
MLNKIASHPILQHDGDLKIFLESEAFNVDVIVMFHKFGSSTNRDTEGAQHSLAWANIGLSVFLSVSRLVEEPNLWNMTM